MWSDRHIAAELPVKITYPLEISEHLKVLNEYIDSNVWPAGAPIYARESIRETMEKIMPRAEAEITHGVRTTAAAAICDDGSRAVIPRNEVLTPAGAGTLKRHEAWPTKGEAVRRGNDKRIADQG